jgi:lysophospholipase
MTEMSQSAEASSAPAPAPFDRRAIPSTATVGRWDTPDGWPHRTITWGAPDRPSRGSLLFLGGRGDHIEKYLESFEDWRHRGWAVESVDWRGQGGSGRTSPDPHVGHIDDFAIWIDDIAAFVTDWTARTPGPHVIIGHSMGGHLVLRALAERRIAPDAAVLVAPMLGFLAPYPDWLGQKVGALMCRIGDPARAAWKMSEKPGSPVRLRQLLLTHDDDRYADEQYWHIAAPETLLGPGSWRWAERAYASFIKLAAPDTLEAITIPMLLLGTSADKLVSPKAIVRDAARLPNASLHIYGAEAAHELLREADGVRNDALARIDDFLEQAAPKP